jgi:alkylation response protein AidB-like acyl-CoA dehydrogenase
MEIIFQDARVPGSNLLGEMNRGFKVAMETLNGGRIGIAAQAVGIARAAFERALEYSQTRKQFDQPIGSFQGIQWKLADMATRPRRRTCSPEAAREGPRPGHAAAAAEAKLFAPRRGQRGRRGGTDPRRIRLRERVQVERHYRDAKITIYEEPARSSAWSSRASIRASSLRATQ